jgi:hypothetical protein
VGPVPHQTPKIFAFRHCGDDTEVSISGVFSDAWRVYLLLFRRSVVMAALVYGTIDLIDAAGRLGGASQDAFFGFLTAVLSVAGQVLVQGAVVLLMRDVHEGRAPRAIAPLLIRVNQLFARLFGGSIVYAVGVVGGLLLLVVPGLILAARWCLIAPSIVLEDTRVMEAKDRSAALVRGQTGRVLAVAVLSIVVVGAPTVVAWPLLSGSSWAPYLFAFAWSSLSAPFSAHVLSVLYYRLTDPERPVIHESVRGWRSVWEGA